MPSPHGNRVALYIRVSTVDQNPQMQFDELRSYARERSWKIIGEFVDQGVSGIQSNRPGLRALLSACHARQVDVVLIWKLDRLGRSLEDLVRLVKTFEGLGINFVSLRNPGLDTTTPAGKLFFGISAVFAEFERDLIGERTRAGIAAARARGKHLGRPRAEIDLAHVGRLREMGLSVRQIAKSLHVSKTLISDILRDRREGDRE